VKHVLDVRLSQRPIIPNKETPAEPGEAESETDERDLTPVPGRMVEVADDTLLCSLSHVVEIAEV
jgi:hypothetical protein